jgi:hypothetical protein
VASARQEINIASPQSPAKISNLNQDRQRFLSRLLFRLFACAICRTELNEPRLVRPLPWGLESALYRLPRVYGFVVETHTYLHRMASRYKRRYGAYFVSHLPLSELGEDGVRVPNIRVRSCIDDMRNYAESHPWATILDLEMYRDAWLAGAEWADHNSCKPDTVIVPNHP